MVNENTDELDPTEIESIRHRSSQEYGSTETMFGGEKDLDPTETPLAPLSERFAALCMDSILLSYLFAFAYPFILERFHQNIANPLHWARIHQLSLLGIFAVGVFFYFFLFEGIFARTPGKFLCRISVANLYGSPPSIFSVLIRNLFRFVDLLLFPITGFGLVEATSKRQRLGDLLSGTTVRSIRLDQTPVVPLDEVRWGTVTRRTVVLLLDLVIFTLAALFFLLALPTHRPQLCQLILNGGPILVIAYWMGFETFLGGTPAKLFLGLTVVDEGVRPVRLPASFIRNLFRLLDHNPLGYLCAVLAARKQRPGDLAARTSVIRSPWSAKRLFSFLIGLLLITGLGYYGIHNPKSFVRTDHQVQIGPWVVPELPSQMKYFLGYRLYVKEFYFGKPDAPAGEKPHYLPGEIVHTTLQVSGFAKEQGGAWLQQDLLVLAPTGETLIDLLNVTNRRFDVGQNSQQTLSSSFLIPPTVTSGEYTVRVRVRDALGEMQGESKGTFLVR